MVADVVASIASHRSCRPASGVEAALGDIEKNNGMFYDGDAVDACLWLFKERKFELE